MSAAEWGALATAVVVLAAVWTWALRYARTTPPVTDTTVVPEGSTTGLAVEWVPPPPYEPAPVPPVESVPPPPYVDVPPPPPPPTTKAPKVVRPPRTSAARQAESTPKAKAKGKGKTKAEPAKAKRGKRSGA